jgi:lysophospholipase L1-like esterase
VKGRRNIVYKSGKFFYGIAIIIFINCEGWINSEHFKEIPLFDCNNLFPPPKINIRAHSDDASKNYNDMIEFFKIDPVSSGDIVLLGNSLVFNGGDWSKRTKSMSCIKNRGIPGDVTEGVLNRLGEIVCVKPKFVFLEIGLNDMYYPWLSEKLIASNILTIAYTIHQNSPTTKLFIHTVLPTANEKLNRKIKKTNEIISRNIDRKLFNLIDLYLTFSDESGLIKKSLTSDGTHLSEAGYLIWVKELKKHFN